MALLLAAGVAGGDGIPSPTAPNSIKRPARRCGAAALRMRDSLTLMLHQPDTLRRTQLLVLRHARREILTTSGTALLIKKAFFQ